MRQWINRWIGENRNWDKDMERVMKMDDGAMMRDLKKLGGKRALLDLGDTKVHTLLDLYKKKHFDDVDGLRLFTPEVIDQSSNYSYKNNKHIKVTTALQSKLKLSNV